MPDTSARIILITAGLLGAIGVAVGAFGAHGLPTMLEGQGLETEVVQRRVENLETGIRYLLVHVVAMLAIAALPALSTRSRVSCTALWCLGMLLFSFGLVVYAVTGNTIVVRIVPVGGLSFIVGWIVLAIGGWRMSRTLQYRL